MISDPRHRAKFRQLWIDQVREHSERNGSLAELEVTTKISGLAELKQTTPERIRALSREELRIELANHDMTDSPPDFALRALKAKGYPQHELTREEAMWCLPKLGSALSWCCYDILRGPESHVMLLDERTAKAVADSKNEPATAAELQHLPHNPCLIEFYRPIEIAENVKLGIRLRAVGFKALGGAEFPVAAVCFFLDYWQAIPSTQTKWPATIGIWFSGFCVTTFDRAAYTQIGFERGSVIEDGIIEVCQRVARNLWDFITSRSIRYEHFHRKPARKPATEREVPQSPAVRTFSDREITFLYLSRDGKSTGDGNGLARATLLDHRIEVLGTFHEFVYCAKCGDLHRHDLLGQACRKCGETVGPRANVRVEKYWHSPYVKGPEGAPLKEVIRDVHRRKPRR